MILSMAVVSSECCFAGATETIIAQNLEVVTTRDGFAAKTESLPMPS